MTYKNTLRSEAEQRERRKQLFLVLGILLVAVSMRTPITANGVLTEMIRDDFGITSAMAGWMTAVPLLVFCVSSPFMSRVAVRFGINRVLLAGLILEIIGQVLRTYTGFGGFLFGTALMALGVSTANVLLPSLIKLRFPLKVGFLTSLYITIMTLSSSFSSGFSRPMAMLPGVGWRYALLFWVVTASVAALLWVFLQRPGMYPTVVAQAADTAHRSVWTQALSWQVTFFMGLQSLIFFSMVSWLPSILVARGLGDAAISTNLFLFQAWSIPGSFVAPIIAAKLRDQRYLGMISGASYLMGVALMLMQANTWWVYVAVFFLGIGGGSTIGLAMLFFNLRTRDSLTSAKLSGMAQTVGYLLAAGGPIVLGYLYDMTASWQWPLTILTGVGIVLTVMGYLAGRDRYVA